MKPTRFVSARTKVNPELRLLGRFSLRSAGREIAVPSGRVRALLAFLSCNLGRPYTREKLVGLLWADHSEEQARQSLRQALSKLRRSLGPNLIDADRSEVRMKEELDCDVIQFLNLVESGDSNGLEQSLALYEDDLLPGFSVTEKSFMDWLSTERARLREFALGVLETLMIRAAHDLTPERQFEYAQRALSLDPYREEAHRQLIRALASMGRRNDALMHYQQLKKTFQNELGVEPDPATRVVEEEVRAGGIESVSSISHTNLDRSTSGKDRAHVRQSSSAIKPGIAVLPFESLGNDTKTSRLADGITEDIITDLSRFRGLDVIARNSTATYKAKPIDARQVGEDLNVSYVLMGTIQRQGGQVRVTAQLIDSSTGTTLWSDRWDRPDTDIFAIQTEVGARLATTLGGMAGSAAITVEEMQKARRRPPENLTAYDYYLLANQGRTVFTDESISAGIEAATKAIELEPTLGRAYVARAWLNYITVHQGADFETAMQAMEADARQALSLDPYDAEARVALAFYLSGRARFEESEAQIEAALQANPTNAQVLVVSAAMLAWGGKTEVAADMADKVLRLDPWMTSENLNCVKDAYFLSQRFDDVISVVSRIPLEARGRGARIMLTLSYALLNREAEAARARTELLVRYPKISAELLLNQDWICARREEEELLLAGFRAAGLPLCASEADLANIESFRRLPECQSRLPEF